MEVDHFNPTPNKDRNKYENLFLATRHCNGSKSNTWPSRAMRKAGIHLLNPCVEPDYGHHIFEHPVTHRLIGITPAGKFHITTCDLNATHLIAERRDRAEILEILKDTPISMKGDVFAFPSVQYKLLYEQVEKMIPPIPYLPKEHPEYEAELQLLQAMCQ